MELFVFELTRIVKKLIQILEMIEIMNPDYLKHNLDYMYDYAHIILAFVKFLDEPSVIICLSCHPGVVDKKLKM
jgi:hypothetical protein